MSDIERVPPHLAREKVQSGYALLVCAYEDDNKYSRMRLDGSMSLSEFRAGISGIAKDKEIFFF